ncbi:MAG: Terminase-like family protein [Candidatus Bathyarchaeota archaeon BA2]|nr:MAG: Terminase-like family protein [Candidatus Bathyarchaeota archaeon BA2]
MKGRELEVEEGSREAKLKKIRGDPVLFAEVVLGVKPFRYQEKLLRDQSKRLVACMGRQTGKTTTIAIKAVHFAFCNADVTVLITAPSRRQSIIMFSKIAGFIFRTVLRRSVIRSTQTTIQLSNGSEIIALPCSGHLLRGFTAQMVIVDEASYIPEEVITNILYPMLATTNGSLILLSTPWGKDHFFYRAFVDPDFSVYRVKSSECPLISEKFLKKQREFMTTETYRMEYEAEFVEAATSYFPQDLIRSCIDPELELERDLEGLARQEGDFYAGCDLGKLQDYSVFAVVQKTRDHIKLVFLREFPLETSYSSIIGFMVQANKKFNLRRILIDRSGVGEVAIEEIKAQGLANAEGQSFTMQSKAEMLANLRVKMEQGAFKMPYNHRLCQQINEQRYEYTKSGKLMFWHPPNSHDDQLWALALACYASKDDEPRGVLARAW